MNSPKGGLVKTTEVQTTSDFIITPHAAKRQRPQSCGSQTIAMTTTGKKNTNGVKRGRSPKKSQPLLRKTHLPPPSQHNRNGFPTAPEARNPRRYFTVEKQILKSYLTQRSTPNSFIKKQNICCNRLSCNSHYGDKNQIIPRSRKFYSWESRLWN